MRDARTLKKELEEAGKELAQSFACLPDHNTGCTAVSVPAERAAAGTV